MIELYTDGGARGNPGPAGGGFAGYKDGKEVFRGSEFYGKKTNNQAEYLALRDGLRAAYAKYPDAGVRCFVDSQLVAEQIKGNYKVKSENVRPLFEEVSRIAGQFRTFQIEHIPRKKNLVADGLANKAMDERG